jgi:hypothetical protein
MFKTLAHTLFTATRTESMNNQAYWDTQHRRHLSRKEREEADRRVLRNMMNRTGIL